MRAQAPTGTSGAYTMRFYNRQHQFYCGIDLHARSMYLCIRDQGGAVLLHKNLPAEADFPSRPIWR